MQEPSVGTLSMFSKDSRDREDGHDRQKNVVPMTGSHIPSVYVLPVRIVVLLG